jgi:hypothetical protein
MQQQAKKQTADNLVAVFTLIALCVTQREATGALLAAAWAAGAVLEVLPAPPGAQFL